MAAKNSSFIFHLDISLQSLRGFFININLTPLSKFSSCVQRLRTEKLRGRRSEERRNLESAPLTKWISYFQSMANIFNRLSHRRDFSCAQAAAERKLLPESLMHYFECFTLETF